MKDLPLELLRTFVATVDSGSMAKAAALVGRTPSAVSLQMSRLGELIADGMKRLAGAVARAPIATPVPPPGVARIRSSG